MYNIRRNITFGNYKDHDYYDGLRFGYRYKAMGYTMDEAMKIVAMLKEDPFWDQGRSGEKFSFEIVEETI